MSGSIMYSFTVGAARASLSSLDSLPGGSNARLHSPLSICRGNKGHQWLQAPGGGKSSRGVPEATSTTSLGEIEVTSRIGLLWSLVGGLMRPGMRERRDRLTNPWLRGQPVHFPRLNPQCLKVGEKTGVSGSDTCTCHPIGVPTIHGTS